MYPVPVLTIEVSADALVNDLDSYRVKFNVGVQPVKRADGSLGPQIVLMHLSREEAAEFAMGRRYSVSFVLVDEGPETVEIADVGDA